MIESASTTRLRRAMSAAGITDVIDNPRRPPPVPDPKEGELYVVEWQPPDGASDHWIFADSYGSLEGAVEDARGLTDPDSGRRPVAGTCVVVRLGASIAWVGVALEVGEVVKSPPVPLNAPPVRTGVAPNWVEVWNGPTARASWMLRQCADVDRRTRLVPAAVACAREAVPVFPAGGGSPLAETCDLLDRWSRGEASDDEVEDARREAMADRSVPRLSSLGRLRSAVLDLATASGRRPYQLAHDAGFVASYAALVMEEGAASTRALRGRWYAQDNKLSAEVRRAIPLGVVLLSRLPEAVRRGSGVKRERAKRRQRSAEPQPPSQSSP